MKKKININYIETSSFSLIEGDTRFKCDHELAEVEPPCCSGFSGGLPDCGCGGSYGVYCYDCNNEDLEQYEVDAIIDAYIGNLEDAREAEACYA